MTYSIGIDIGGTFTDFVILDDHGIGLDKVLSTPADPSQAVMAGLGQLAEARGLELHELLPQVDRVVHGTTIADNALIQTKGVKTGLLTTDGFRDELVLRRGFKEDIWDPQYPPPPDIVPRRRRLGVIERLAADGEVVTPLDEDSARAAIRRLRLQEVESVAIVTLFSYVNAAHEQRLAELVAEEMPGVDVSLSHEIMPKAPEFERVSTTVVNAYVGPLVTRYLDRIVEQLGDRVALLVMQSTGGVMTRPYIRRRPIQVLASGPAGGVIGCAAVGRAKQQEDLLCVDMGGTSYDVSLVKGGEAPGEPGWNWHHRFLCGLPMISVTTLGAGGGSIAHVESGALEVGPQSAGAEPGPICYGNGGTQPTVTDANLVLGLLSADAAFAGGSMSLSMAGVREAFAEQVAAPMGHDSVERAASDVRRVVNANMSQAIRRLTAERGVDPTTLTMVAYGGNGPVHACVQAEDLGIRRVIVSRHSAAFSALGLLTADPTIDEERSYLTPSPDVARVRDLWSGLIDGARAYFVEGGFGDGRLRYDFQLNFRYPGQNWSLAVPVAQREGSADVSWFDEAALAEAVAGFHRIHEEEHTYARHGETPELTSVRAIVSTPVRHPDLGGAGTPGTDTTMSGRTRRADLGAGFCEVAVHDGSTLTPGASVAGPAIVEEQFTTIVVNDGWTATVDAVGDYVLAR
ncbi:MAG TPA: hydantoinase/oxoprolinase family protein [Baekduia sp.]|uniref:hydantoinase/oxoprolinase family protein n=1 Tax=Baekduia sp. TaxID=2600305 RepID=UPI002CB090E1|nr:hydantoinase/oxoprolinase family protein [Baekduia sp.]HMJ37856.1 hydantoinase/oxoprolinase family protein [Baekduia sp.]